MNETKRSLMERIPSWRTSAKLGIGASLLTSSSLVLAEGKGFDGMGILNTAATALAASIPAVLTIFAGIIVSMVIYQYFKYVASS